MIDWQSATVTEIAAPTATIKTFRIAPATPFAFVAGQHVDVRLTAPDGYHAVRSYSIASAPEDPSTIELAIERLGDGEVSPFFHDVVAVGDAIELRGPLGGYFLWPQAQAEPVFLAGGGSGIVPLMSMLRHRARSGDRRRTVLLYSARTWADALYRDELLELERNADGFTLVFTLTRDVALRPDDFSRRADAELIAAVLHRTNGVPAATFICGSNPFVTAVADGAVAAGVPFESIRTERYG